jgi:hypothetical protein
MKARQEVIKMTAGQYRGAGKKEKAALCGWPRQPKKEANSSRVRPSKTSQPWLHIA